MSEVIHVAVAVIRNPAGQVFITMRPDHVHQGGLWEFPGGKVESGESVQQALRREIHEENGIDVLQVQPLIKIPYQYPDKHVLLDVWEVVRYRGEAHGREGQAFRWVALGDLHQYDFPLANRSIVTAVQLPRHYLITPEPGDDIKLFLSQLECCLEQDIKLVQLRAKQLDRRDYVSLAKEVITLCQQYETRLLLNTTLEVFAELSALYAVGIHITSQRLMALSDRPVPEDCLFAASCHNPGEIAQANLLGADFIVLGPVKPTASHPHQRPMGWESFVELSGQAAMPVYALGGMTMGDVEQSRNCGGQGIAAVRSLWRDN